MTITVTTDLSDISLCETTTDGGTWTRLNGTTSANPAADGDAYIQGGGSPACIANKMGNTTGTTDVGGHLNCTNTFDVTNKHIFHWRQIVTAGNMLTKANRGICLGLTNTSTTSATAWSSTNYKLWFLDGADTVPAAIGWNCYVLDPSSTADASAGTLTLSTVKNIGFICRQNSSVTSTVSNQFVDAIRIGTGLTGTTNSAADTLTFESLYSVDSTKANSWGIITKYAGTYLGSGKITIGSASQTNTCLFKDTNGAFKWKKMPVADTLYEFNLVGASGHVTTFQLGNKDGSGNTSDGFSITRESTALWTITCGNYSEFKAYSSPLSGIKQATLSSTSELKNCPVTNSGVITTNGATITNCQFSSHITTQLKVQSTSEMSAITSCTFTRV